MREEEAQHFPRRVRSSRIGVGAGGTASRPCVAGTVNAPMFGNCPPARVGKDGTGIGMPAGHPSAKDLRCTRRFGGLLKNSVAVVRVHRGVAIAMENDGRHGRSGREVAGKTLFPRLASKKPSKPELSSPEL